MDAELLLEHRGSSRYGWKPSLPDPRDIPADPSGITIAAEVDPRPNMPSVYDQGQLGSCTANAVGAAVQYHFSLDGVGDFKTNPSRLFIYYGEREIEGSVSEDAGAYGRDGFKVCHNIGVPDESVWRYDTARFADKPPPEAYAEAAKHKIGPYKAVPRTITAFKSVLSNKQTIAFGFSVFDSFESSAVARTGIMPVPLPSERMLGGHEVLAVGFLKKYPHHCLVRNSWGTGWGIGGYFLMPWTVLMDHNMSSDFRTIYRPLGA